MHNLIIALAFVGALLAGSVMPVLADQPPPGIHMPRRTASYTIRKTRA